MDKILTIEAVDYDVERTDRHAQVWIRTSIKNHTDSARRAELTLVLEKRPDRETIEIVEIIEPGTNELHSVIRVMDIAQWDESEKTCQLMLGLLCEGAVQDTKELSVQLD